MITLGVIFDPQVITYDKDWGEKSSRVGQRDPIQNRDGSQ